MRHFEGLGYDQIIEIQRVTSQLKVEEYGDGMGQYLSDQAMLVVPQIADTDTSDGKTFGQM